MISTCDDVQNGCNGQNLNIKCDFVRCIFNFSQSPSAILFASDQILTNNGEDLRREANYFLLRGEWRAVHDWERGETRLNWVQILYINIIYIIYIFPSGR